MVSPYFLELSRMYQTWYIIKLWPADLNQIMTFS